MKDGTVKRRKYTEAELYIVWVMWVTGFSEPSIARVIGARTKQIAGIVNRSPYPNRSAMSDEERQNALDELLAARIGEDGHPIDGGLLGKAPTRIIPLRSAQVRIR